MARSLPKRPTKGNGVSSEYRRCLWCFHQGGSSIGRNRIFSEQKTSRGSETDERSRLEASWKRIQRIGDHCLSQTWPQAIQVRPLKDASTSCKACLES